MKIIFKAFLLVFLLISFNAKALTDSEALEFTGAVNDGDLETVKLRKASSKVITSDEPFMETHTPAKSKNEKKDFASTLDERSKKHYEKMMSAGVYKSWEEIEAEQKWTPKVIRTGK